MYLHRIVSDIDDNLPSVPSVPTGGSLLIMVGLPGTGKSSIVEALQPDLPCCVISTDNIRLQMRNQPIWQRDENMWQKLRSDVTPRWQPVMFRRHKKRFASVFLIAILAKDAPQICQMRIGQCINGW